MYLIIVIMKMKLGILSSAVVATALAVTGCAGSAPTTSAGGATEKINVTVAAYPLQFLTERILGEAGTVTNLTAPGAEPHDLELSAKQIADMSASAAVVYIAGFQPAVDEAIKSTPPQLAIDVTDGVPLLDATHEEEGEEGPAHGAHDPHIWLAPADMIIMAKTISTKLSTAKPALAATLAANTTKLVADLTALDSSFTSGLANCQIKQFVTSHTAFAYLANAYSLQQIGIAGLEPTEEPTAARIAEVQKLAKEHGVTTIFFETLVSDAVAKSIAGDLGLKTAVLDPIEGITSNSAGTNYLEVMASNLKALQEANKCS
jgi:zinc transport system substrate-binding protein